MATLLTAATAYYNWLQNCLHTVFISTRRHGGVKTQNIYVVLLFSTMCIIQVPCTVFNYIQLLGRPRSHNYSPAGTCPAIVGAHGVRFIIAIFPDFFRGMLRSHAHNALQYLYMYVWLFRDAVYKSIWYYVLYFRTNWRLRGMDRVQTWRISLNSMRTKYIQ